MSTDNYGIVYVLSNPAMPNMVKVGMTSRDSIEDRLSELFSTGVPVPFDCEYACRVDDYSRVEKALHIAFNPYRVHPKREFFNIDPEQAIVILKLVATEDVTPDVVKEINAERDPEDAASSKKLKQQRRPPLNYKEMGIPVGAILKYYEDEIQVKVLSERKVEYKGQEMSLSAVTRDIMGLDYHVQPTKYWSFDGKNLQDIYNETYTSIDDQ